MEFSIKELSPEKAKTGCVVVGVYQEHELTAPARRLDQAAKGKLRQALRDLSGKTGSTLLARLPGIAAERVLLVGLGERREFAEPAYRDAVRAAANALRDLGAKDAALYLGRLDSGQRLVRPIDPGRHAWVQVATGTVDLAERTLRAGDGAAVSGERSLTLVGRDDAEVLVFDLK